MLIPGGKIPCISQYDFFEWPETVHCGFVYVYAAFGRELRLPVIASFFPESWTL